MNILITLLCIVLHQALPSLSSCRPQLTRFQDSVLTLHDQPATANLAQQNCSHLGGSLAKLIGQQIDDSLSSVLNAKYRAGLVRVWIFYRKDDPRNYAYSLSERGPRLTGYTWLSARPPLGELRYIDLYNSTTSRAGLEEIHFCTNFYRRWYISVNGCVDGEGAWTRDFKLQAKTTPFKGFKPVYHYRQIINGGTYASRLSDVDAPKDGFIVRQDPLYLPDSAVFVGARFDPAVTKHWLWGDGAIANFVNRGGNACLQKALHYGIGWELVDRSCTDTLLNYICQVLLHPPIVRTKECDPSSLQFQPKGDFSKLEKQVAGLTVSNITFLTQPQMTTESVPPGTTFTVKSRVTFSGCQSIFGLDSKQASVTTGLDVPQDVANASLIPSSLCQIFVPAQSIKPGRMDATHFRITATSNKIVTIHTFPANITSQQILTIPVFDQQGHTGGVSLEIEATARNCSSAKVHIPGACFAAGTSQSPEMTSPTVTKPAHQKTTTTSSMWNVSTNAATHITDIYNYSTNNASALPFVETTTSRVDPTTSQVDSGNGGQAASSYPVGNVIVIALAGVLLFAVIVLIVFVYRRRRTKLWNEEEINDLSSKVHSKICKTTKKGLKQFSSSLSSELR